MIHKFTQRQFSNYLTILFFALLAAPSVLEAQCVTGNTGGVVWLDSNNDGIQDATETQGISGVTVTAYDGNGTAVATTTTNALGQYTFSTFTPSTTNKYRIEFTNYPTPYQATFNGTNGRTEVQFVSAASCTINLGMNDPRYYCETNPMLIVPCYASGNSTGNTDAAIVNIPYTASGVPTFQGGTGVNPTQVANIATVGSVWGVAVQPDVRRVFTSAFLKRHVGLGPLGLGGVYVLDYGTGTPTVSGSFNLQSVVPANGGSAIDFGSVNRSGSADYTLPTKGLPSIDLDAFDKVGKVGYGDADIDEVGKKLWLVNLNQRALISVDVSGTTGSLPGVVNQYLLSSLAGAPSCNNGVLRPFGLGFKDGKGYLGCECTAENGGTSADLKSYILSFNPANMAAGLVQEVSFDMTYTRELKGGSTLSSAKWNPWYSTWQSVLNTLNYHLPEPLVSDIEIDNNGGFSIALMDRLGHQGGYNNYPAVSGYNGSASISIIGTGDIVKICKVGGTYVLEGNAGCPVSDPGNFTSGSVTNDGLANKGEFYYDDYYSTEHEEIVIGGLGGHPTKDKIISTVYDPVGAIFTQGLHWYDQNTGARTQRYQVLPDLDLYFGKAGGLGDIGVLCGGSPIQIGNRVWLDTNKDGIQNASETGISNINVSLKQGQTVVAQTTTDANGEYYFGGFNNQGIIPILATPVTKNVFVSNTRDDVRQSSTSVSSTAPLFFTRSYLGLRFPNANIPTGSVITSAKIRFISSDYGGDILATIKGYKNPNAPFWTEGTLPFTGSVSDLYANNATTASVSWSGSNAWLPNDSGPNQTTPNLSSIVQEIINMPSWGSSSQSLAFVIDATGIFSNYSTAWGQTSEIPGNHPVLELTYQPLLTIPLQANQAYSICIPMNQSQMINIKPTGADTDASTNGDIRDSDGTISGTDLVKNITTPSFGAVNQTYDFGFSPFCQTITNPSPTQTLCLGSTGSDITVNTSTNIANSIRFVKFTTDQSATNGSETATELTNIYAGTSIATVTPTGTSDPYTATYTFNAADFPTAGTYYVYAILNPDQGATCRPVQEIKIVISPGAAPSTPSVTSPVNNICPLTTVDLTTISSALTPSVSGGVFEWHVSNSSSSAIVSNQTDVTVGDYYLFEKSPAGCYSAGSKVHVQINACCPPKVCIPVTITRN